MPIDLSAFLPVPDTEGDAEQIANGFTAIETYLNTLNPSGGDTTQAGQVTADFDSGDASVVFATPFADVPIVTGSVNGAGTFEPKNITVNGFDVHVGWIAPVGTLTAYWFARLDSADAPPQDTDPASGMGSPAGSVTPAFVGQLYIDLTAGALYQADGPTDADWNLVGSGGSSGGRTAVRKEVTFTQVAAATRSGDDIAANLWRIDIPELVVGVDGGWFDDTLLMAVEAFDSGWQAKVVGWRADDDTVDFTSAINADSLGGNTDNIDQQVIEPVGGGGTEGPFSKFQIIFDSTGAFDATLPPTVGRVLLWTGLWT